MKTWMSDTVIGIVSLSLLGFTSLTGCSSVKSAASAFIPGEKKPEEKIKVGARLHLKVAPQVALMLLQDVATENDWKVLSAGDQRDINGEVKGKFFRVETIKFVGGRRVMSGVFFKDADDEEKSMVMMGKPAADVEYGIPLELVKPMQAAVAEWTGEPARLEEFDEQVELDEREEFENEEGSLEEAMRGNSLADEPEELEELDELDELDVLNDLGELEELEDEKSPLEEVIHGDS